MNQEILEQNQIKVIVLNIYFQWDKITQGEETKDAFLVKTLLGSPNKA